MQIPRSNHLQNWGVLLVLALAWTQTAFPRLRAEELPLSQEIDQVVAATYVGPEIPPASDLEFQRRIYLDLIGRGPTARETTDFLAKVVSFPNEPSKARTLLIDDLLTRDDFAFYYSKVLEVMFTERREVISTLEFRAFIRKWLEENRPLNELCMEILAGDGTGGDWRAAGSFIINRNAEPNLVTRDVSRIFLGRDVRCAQCHDHPLIDDYNQSDYYGILSFVNRTYLFTDEKRGNLPFLGEKGEGDLEFNSVFRPQDGKLTAQPILPMSIAMDAEPDFADSSDIYIIAPGKTERAIPRYSRRQQLAVLATHPENESFNRNIANRLWANMMGQGVVHPVDMHHADNPPVNSALLRLLSHYLVNSNYDLKEFLRQIARSKTYQRSSQVANLDSWMEPNDLTTTLELRVKNAQESTRQFESQRSQYREQLMLAGNNLTKSQADVTKLQHHVHSAKQQLQLLVEQLAKESKALAELKTKQATQQELVKSLKVSLQEVDKILQATPADTELTSYRALLEMRLTAANMLIPALDDQLEEQQEKVEKVQYQINDQRSRIHSLVNRHSALSMFVVEARGVERHLRKQVQVVDDKLADLKRQEEQISILNHWRTRRSAIRHASSTGNAAEIDSQKLELEVAETELLEMWRRSFGLFRIRALSPEQMSGATYYALEMHTPIEERSKSEWATMHQANLEMRDDEKRQRHFIAAAISNNIWDTVEDLIVPRFSFAPGSPQDGFFATVDQALVLQNDATLQGWLKPATGNLLDRLTKTEDPELFAEQLYLAILCRLPDPEERKVVAERLNSDVHQRAAVVQELVWGLLASAEFRFLL